MPVSKKRKKKNGKPVGRGSDRLTGLTLQDLINVVAYQEAHPEEAAGIKHTIAGEVVDGKAEIDFSDPDTQAVIKAVNTIKLEEENEDGRQ